MATIEQIRELLSSFKAEIKAEIKAEMTELKAEMTELKVEIKAEMTELKAEMTELKAEMKAELTSGLTDIRREPRNVEEAQEIKQREESLLPRANLAATSTGMWQI